MRRLRLSFWTSDQPKKKIYLLLDAFWNRETNDFAFRVNGKTVCVTAFRDFYGITQYMYYNVRKVLFEGGDINDTHGNAYRTYSAGMAEMINSWLHLLARILGDNDPASYKIYLPVGLSKIDIYDAFFSDHLAVNHDLSEIPGTSYFYKIWREQFPNLHVIEKNRLGICNVCSDFEVEFATLHTNAARQLNRWEKREHISQVQQGTFKDAGPASSI